VETTWNVFLILFTVLSLGCYITDECVEAVVVATVYVNQALLFLTLYMDTYAIILFHKTPIKI